MANKVPLFLTNGPSSGAGTTSYFPLFSGPKFGFATNAECALPWYYTGTITRLTAYVNANAATASSTITLFKNGVATALTITIPAGAGPGTGLFEDLSNSVSFTSSDTLTFQQVIGTGGAVQVFNLGAYVEEAAGKMIMRVGTAGTGVNNGANNATRYYALTGASAISITDNNTVRFTMREGCRIKNLIGFLSNTRPTSITIMSTVVNGVSNNPYVSLAAAFSGFFSNTSNSVSIVDGDVVSMRIFNSGGGGGTVTVTCGSVDIEYSGNAFQMFSNIVAGLVNSTSASRFFPLSGSLNTTATEQLTQIKLLDEGTIKNLSVTVLANANATSVTNFYARIAGADTAVAVAVPISTTGIKADTTNTAPFTNGQTVNIRTIKSVTSGVSINNVSLVVEYPPSFVPFGSFFM